MTFYEWFTTAPTEAEVKAQHAGQARSLEAEERRAAITAWRLQHPLATCSDSVAWVLIEMARRAGRDT